MQELIQESLWRKAGRVCRDGDNVSSRLWGPGLVFLKYMSHAFDQLFKEPHVPQISQVSNDTDLRKVENLLYIPKKSSWEYVMERVNRLGIGRVLDEAMESIERYNPAIRQILPREYASPKIREDQLALFMEMLGQIPNEYSRTGEILQSVFAYFVRNNLAAGDKRQEALSLPECVDKLLVGMVRPVRGKIFDPCCGAGCLLVESRNYISQQKDPSNSTDLTKEIVFYGLESKLTNFRLCRMNLAIHGMDGTHTGWNGKNCLEKDLYPDLKADHILCAPPCGENENTGGGAWLEYIVSHLAAEGTAGIVLPKDSMAVPKKTPTGVDARETFLGKGNTGQMLQCIVSLPDHLFRAAGMSACLWILGKGKSHIRKGPDRRGQRDGEVLLINVSSDIPGQSPSPWEKEMVSTDIDEIAAEITATFHRWQDKNGDYKDVKGFCKSVHRDTIKGRNYNLTPGIYV
ncbi:MAG: SAM-dependent DNA methyltransferase [bacterium]|nr:SAM-dependent DNA methyltransferase [bacterium]